MIIIKLMLYLQTWLHINLEICLLQIICKLHKDIQDLIIQQLLKIMHLLVIHLNNLLLKLIHKHHHLLRIIFKIKIMKEVEDYQIKKVLITDNNTNFLVLDNKKFLHSLTLLWEEEAIVALNMLEKMRMRTRFLILG